MISARWAAGIASVEIKLDRYDRKRVFVRLNLDEARKLRADLADVIAEREPDEATRQGEQGGAVSALAQEVVDSQAGQHELNEAIRIADHWRHVNEDAAELLRHVVNARESYLALVRAADAAVRAAEAAPDALYECPECGATQPEPGRCGRCPGVTHRCAWDEGPCYICGRHVPSSEGWHREDYEGVRRHWCPDHQPVWSRASNSQASADL